MTQNVCCASAQKIAYSPEHVLTGIKDLSIILCHKKHKKTMDCENDGKIRNGTKISPMRTPKFYNEFDESLGIGKNTKRVCLQIGSPGAHILKDVAKIMKKSTEKHFDDSNPRNEELLQYGVCAGNWNFREELAEFLTIHYRNPVNRDDLFIHSGVSQGVANLLYHYFQNGETVFVEDPSYWNFIAKFDGSFKLNIVGIGMDENGFKVHELEKQLETLERRKTSDRYPFQAAVYVIPVHQNPTGSILSQDRCQHLVKLARKHDLMIIADEVYNVLTYSAPDCKDPLLAKPPTRLFWHDKKSDPDYKGNVVSIGSVSKFLAPGLRVGWYEMPTKMIRTFESYFVTDSGSAWSQYTSGILAWAFHLGLVQEHVLNLRKRYWKLFNEIHELVNSRLGKHGVSCNLPDGGCFMWITLPEGYSTDRLYKRHSDEMTFITGTTCSVSNSHENCLRICIAFYDEDVLLPTVRKLCDYIVRFLQEDKRSLS